MHMYNMCFLMENCSIYKPNFEILRANENIFIKRYINFSDSW